MRQMQTETLKSKGTVLRLVRSGALAYLILACLLITAEIVSPGFLALGHIDSVLRQAAFLGIVAIGQTFVILTGGIDLSVASVILLANVMSAQIMDGQNANTPAAVALVLAMGVVVGLVNGLGIEFLKISPLVMTLGIGTVAKGVAYIYCGGAPKGLTSPWLKSLVLEKAFGIFSLPTLLWLALSVLVILLLRRSTFGRTVYAMGANEVAANYSGMRVRYTRMLLYVLSAVCSAFLGLLLIGYTGTSFTSTGASYTMDSITAVVVGGTSIMGGAGGYAGTVVGALIVVVLNSLVTTLRVSESGKLIIQGAILLLILLLYGNGTRKKNRA